MSAKVAVRWSGKTIKVGGLPCGVPGLAIVLRPSGEGLGIVHVRSGAFIGLFAASVSPEAVLAAAQEIAHLADWTVPGTVLQSTPGLADDAYMVVLRWGGNMRGGGAPAATDITEVSA